MSIPEARPGVDTGVMEPARRGRPRSEPFDVQRTRVLDAARDLFTHRGYDATTVADIARHADVPRAVVYETVGDKPAVLSVVADQVADELIAAFGERVGAGAVDASGPPAELVRSTTEWFISRVRDDPTIVAMVRLSGLLPEEEGHGPLRARKGIEDLLTNALVANRPSRARESEPSARLLAVMIVAMTEAVAYRTVDEGWPADLVAGLLTQMTVGGLTEVMEGRSGRSAVRSLNAAVGSSSDGRAGTSGRRSPR